MEGLLESVFCENLLDRESTDHELLVVDVARSINVHMLYQVVNLLLIEVDAADLAEAFNKLISGEFAVAILVKKFELLGQIVQLVLTE